MSERNFQQALKEAERARETRTLPPDAERRIRARVEAAFERRRRFVLPTWTLGLATAVAAVALVVYVIARPARGPAAVNGFVAEQGAAGELLRAQGDAVIATAPVQVVDPRSRIHVIADLGAALKREPQGVRVMSGTVEVSVDKRHAGEPPARVFVSDGLIEILGTRFTISQGAHGGQVTLHEGSIRFRATDGRERMLRPGETLSWPLPPKVATAPSTPAPLPVPGGDRNVAEPPVAPTPPAVASTTPQHRTPKPQPPPTPASPAVTPAAPQPAVDVDALIEELNVLRRRGQFADAAARLERALAQPLPDATSERLSYELGSILTWQLRDTARACKVWKQHQNAHPAGRYAAEIERAEQSLGCQ